MQQNSLEIIASGLVSFFGATLLTVGLIDSSSSTLQQILYIFIGFIAIAFALFLFYKNFQTAIKKETTTDSTTQTNNLEKINTEEKKQIKITNDEDSKVKEIAQDFSSAVESWPVAKKSCCGK